MKLYTYQDTNGEFEEPRPLPRGFNNISNFHFADEETINENGWYECVYETAPEYDESTEIIEETRGLEGNIYRVRYSKREMTAEEKAEYDANQQTILDSMKVGAKYKIDSAAESTRERYITYGSGQAMVYMQKADEARRYFEDGEPSDLIAYPFLRQEVLISTSDASTVANNILTKRDEWIQKGAEIEALRLTLKGQIDSATSVAEIETIESERLSDFDAL